MILKVFLLVISLFFVKIYNFFIQHHRYFVIFEQNIDIMSIGTRVKRFREAKGISQDDLAIRLDVAQSTISSIESDKSIPNSMLLRNIAKELEIDINQLFDDKFTNYNQIEKNDGVVNFGNGTINMQSPELLENIVKNQENISKLIEAQSKLLSELLKK